MDDRIRSHKDLKVWQEAMELVTVIYNLTVGFPEYEKFGLTSQIRRAAVSIPSNIAEGFARKGNKELSQFLYIALGSLAEAETQIQIAINLNYLRNDEELNSRIIFIRIMLSNLIKSIKTKQTPAA